MGRKDAAVDTHNVLILYGWRLIVGRYSVNAQIDLVTVTTSKGGRKSTQIGGTPPKNLAKIMLRELADEGRA